MSKSGSSLHVFVRPPRRGRVKTRLQRELGAVKTLQIYRRLLRQTLSVAADVAARGDLSTIVWSAERPWHPTLRVWCEQGGLQLRTQPRRDLGQRMLSALATGLRRHHSAIVIGSDCPGLDACIIDQARRALSDHDVVIGPALDGGYYLLGVRRHLPMLFRTMRWSHPDVAQQTLRRAEQAKLSVAMLAPLRDVDSVDDLRACRAAGYQI